MIRIIFIQRSSFTSTSVPITTICVLIRTVTTATATTTHCSQMKTKFTKLFLCRYVHYAVPVSICMNIIIMWLRWCSHTLFPLLFLLFCLSIVDRIMCVADNNNTRCQLGPFEYRVYSFVSFVHNKPHCHVIIFRWRKHFACKPATSRHIKHIKTVPNHKNEQTNEQKTEKKKKK